MREHRTRLISAVLSVVLLVGCAGEDAEPVPAAHAVYEDLMTRERIFVDDTGLGHEMRKRYAGLHDDVPMIYTADSLGQAVVYLAEPTGFLILFIADQSAFINGHECIRGCE